MRRNVTLLRGEQRPRFTWFTRPDVPCPGTTQNERSGTRLAYTFAMKAIAETPVIESARKNLSVCVLDDDSSQVELTVERLEKAGFSVVGTTNVSEALQKIRLGECRVVLVDFKMPDMDGLTFLEKVLQFDPGVYVVLVTGHYSVDSAIEAVRRGAYDYLCKPIDFPRLEKTLDDLADLFSQRLQVRLSRRSFSRTPSFRASLGKVRPCWTYSTWRRKSPATTQTF